jgi:hypothetical protein
MMQSEPVYRTVYIIENEGVSSELLAMQALEKVLNAFLPLDLVPDDERSMNIAARKRVSEWLMRRCEEQA